MEQKQSKVWPVYTQGAEGEGRGSDLNDGSNDRAWNMQKCVGERNMLVTLKNREK